MTAPALQLVWDAGNDPTFGGGDGDGPAIITCGHCDAESWTLWSDGTVGCGSCGVEYDVHKILEASDGAE